MSHPPPPAETDDEPDDEPDDDTDDVTILSGVCTGAGWKNAIRSADKEHSADLLYPKRVRTVKRMRCPLSRTYPASFRCAAGDPQAKNSKRRDGGRTVSTGTG